jgi:hypothetical protein
MCLSPVQLDAAGLDGDLKHTLMSALVLSFGVQVGQCTVLPVQTPKKVVVHINSCYWPTRGAACLPALLPQILLQGCFHTDPHPGNLMALTRNGEVCVGLLDFGQGVWGVGDGRVPSSVTQHCV